MKRQAPYHPSSISVDVLPPFRINSDNPPILSFTGTYASWSSFQKSTKYTVTNINPFKVNHFKSRNEFKILI